MIGWSAIFSSTLKEGSESHWGGQGCRVCLEKENGIDFSLNGWSYG